MNPIIRRDVSAIASAPLPWDQLSGATVIVTGASGFLPAYMVETLLFLNDSVLQKRSHIVALVRNRERAQDRFRAYLGRDDLEIVVQDVSCPLTFTGAFEYVIHAASQASPVFYRSDPVGTLSANVLGTHQLLCAAHNFPMKGFLFFSSGEIYGIVSEASRTVGAILSEHDGGFLDPLDLRSCYGESKRMGETMCSAWARQFGTPTRIVRPFHTYGPGMRLDDGRVFADFVRDILHGGPIVLHSDGLARRSFCYLADATLAFFTVLLCGANGEAYNVANLEGECSIAELAERLAVAYGKEGIKVERRSRTGSAYMESPIHSTTPSVDKLMALGWRSSWGIEEGFRRTVDSYRAEGAWNG
jgi:UDP-glucuronate decarboxylase